MFDVQVRHLRHLGGTGDQVQSFVLDYLEFLGVSRTDGGGSGRGGVFKGEADVGLVKAGEGFFVLPPCEGGQGF